MIWLRRHKINKKKFATTDGEISYFISSVTIDNYWVHPVATAKIKLACFPRGIKTVGSECKTEWVWFLAIVAGRPLNATIMEDKHIAPTNGSMSSCLVTFFFLCKIPRYSKYIVLPKTNLCGNLSGFPFFIEKCKYPLVCDFRNSL